MSRRSYMQDRGNYNRRVTLRGTRPGPDGLVFGTPVERLEDALKHNDNDAIRDIFYRNEQVTEFIIHGEAVYHGDKEETEAEHIQMLVDADWSEGYTPGTLSHPALVVHAQRSPSWELEHEAHFPTRILLEMIDAGKFTEEVMQQMLLINTSIDRVAIVAGAQRNEAVLDWILENGVKYGLTRDGLIDAGERIGHEEERVIDERFNRGRLAARLEDARVKLFPWPDSSDEGDNENED